MGKFLIDGGRPLRGTVQVSGAKNSALPIIVAAALADGESVLENVPKGTDVLTICSILQALGASVWIDESSRLHVDGSGVSSHEAPYDLVRKMRASFYVAGLLLSKLRRANVPLPGGCALGSRPVDFHVKGFQQLGAEISTEHGFMKAVAAKLVGTKLYINRSSVGTTINMMLASCMAEGITLLENAAKEPEVVDVAIFLNAMGAKIRGAGTDVIRIEGVPKLSPTEYMIIADRIEAGTFMIAAALTGGDVTLEGVVGEHLRSPIYKLEEAGLQVEEAPGFVRVVATEKPRAVDIQTAVYPGFPTDLQQPFVALMTISEGTSVVRETIFDRFRYVDELRRMGADIKVERDTAIIRGVERLTGAPVEAMDLRAGAALVLAGLAAGDRTEVSGIEHIDRGYEAFAQKLRALGARIQREGDEAEVDFSSLIRPPLLQR